MVLSKKLQNYLDSNIITEEQAIKMQELDNLGKTNYVWKTLYWVAGLLISLGIILLVASNWKDIPDFVKLLGDFAIWIGLIFVLYKSIINQKIFLKELFITLSFGFVGATIGLIGQIFNLNGGWESFSLTWAILALPFILFSKVLHINMLWWILVFAIYFEDIFDFFEKEIFTVGNTTLVVFFICISGLLAFAGTQIYEKIKKIILLPKALSKFIIYFMYIFTAIYTLYWGIFKSVSQSCKVGYENCKFQSIILANILVFVFLVVRLGIAFFKKDMKSFRNNILLAETYIFIFFVSRFENLYTSGIGFITTGILVLLGIYGLKRTSSYIKTLDNFLTTNTDEKK